MNDKSSLTGKIHSMPPTQTFRDNYDTINWDTNKPTLFSKLLLLVKKANNEEV